MAVAAAVYLAWLGPQGLVELGRACAAKAGYAAARISSLEGVRLTYPAAPYFKEFAVSVDDSEAVEGALADRGFLIGPVVEGSLLVACTERRTRTEIDALVDAIGEITQ
jgi:glycine dehydrogenase subunit 1